MNFSNGSYIPKGWGWPFQIDMTPHIVISFIYMVIGVIGNSMVLVVYKYQMKTTSDERYFIPILAVLDVIASVLCSLGTIIWDLMQTNFENVILCKCRYLFASFTASMSFCVLLCIGVQRYLKICRQCALSLKPRKMMIVFSILFSIGFCFPFGVNYGINKYEKNDNIIGNRCSRLKTADYTSKQAFSIVFAVILFCVVLTLFILYGMIGFKILCHKRSNKPTHLPLYADKNKTSNVNTTSDNQIVAIEGKSTNRESFSDAIEAKKGGGPNEMSMKLKNKKQHTLKSQANDCKASAETIYSQAKPTTQTKVDHNRSQKRNNRVKKNINFMFIVITLVSLISYCPLGAVAVMEGIIPDFRTNLTATESHIVLWFHRTFIINSIINPFIYAFLDTEFNEAFKRLFKK
ncbi:Hypothetical predicted protein [Mytilus galloprovincialis]|uniref:G-protein coupled receptors family 1 profile domain-containing protein n=1 Tax=Mytilus galloprovincialis TaxID=29158 RepID=A0A8B6GYB6_MYTGA|nr:Hypothetical predicted protein [Mytilus galloprovincialis]